MTMDKPICPFCELETGKYFPNPESVILSLVSEYRESDMTDKQFAEYICNSLGLLTRGNNLVIKPYGDTIKLVFEKQ